MSNQQAHDLLLEYRGAIQLHLWYSGSRFSFHTGKADPAAAKGYLKHAHEVQARMIALTQGPQTDAPVTR